MDSTSEVLRPMIRTEIFNILSNRATDALERWILANNVDRKYINQNAPQRVANDLVDDTTEEFLDYSENLTEENLKDEVNIYMAESCDDNYMDMQIDKQEDEDEILSLQADDLCLFLENNPKYSSVDRSVWFNAARSVHSISEMSNYLDESGVENFVETYVPDYRESTR